MFGYVDGSRRPIAIFESGAILTCLTEQTQRFGGNDLRNRTAVNEWLMWQVGGLGLMLGQNHHFNRIAWCLSRSGICGLIALGHDPDSNIAYGVRAPYRLADRA